MAYSAAQGVTGWTAISLVIATAGAVVAAVSVLVARRARLEARRSIESAVRQVDESLARIGEALEQALQHAETPAPHTASLGLMLDLDELLLGVAREAAARTGARAAAVRVRGLGDDPAVACFGAEDVAPLLETTVRSPQGRPFRALTVNWTFSPPVEADTRAFRSALVVPLVEDGIETGVIAGYATQSAAFGPEQARALEALAAEAAEGIGRARRFAAMKRRPAAEEDETARPTTGDEQPPSDGVARTEAPGDARL